jgi:hypothetical protein
MTTETNGSTAQPSRYGLAELKWLARPFLLGLATVLMFLDKWSSGALDMTIFGLVAGAWSAWFVSREKEKRSG